MNETDQATPAPRPKRSPVPLAVLVLGGLMMATYWIAVGGGAGLEGWGKDLDEALLQGQRLGRPVLAFFSAPG